MYIHSLKDNSEKLIHVSSSQFEKPNITKPLKVFGGAAGTVVVQVVHCRGSCQGKGGLLGYKDSVCC